MQPIVEPSRSEQDAERSLPRTVFDYYAGGAGDERTVSHNVLAFRAIQFVPRVLRNVSVIDTSTTLPDIGVLSFPALIAPMAMQRMAHDDGEVGVASAAKRVKIPFILSTFSTTSLEDVSKVYNESVLLQLYLFKRREQSVELLRRAKHAGYKAIVFTVDAIKFGRRLRDKRNKFKLPGHLKFANVPVQKPSGGGTESMEQLFDDELDINDIQWIKDVSGLPVWVKGVLHPKDAVDAVNAGASAIVVSNHGGRQVEGCIPSVNALPEIVRAVNKKANVLVDSGVRSGADIVRAIALGADAVLIGRPILWALCRGGGDGVEELLREYQEDMKTTMGLCGVTRVEAIDGSLISVGRGTGCNGRL